mmetsp:Transcript_3098/g.2678  ORF Transcript_3098/g.2678 Transcript_3098/m.2678 type:complete len:80 (+) Transcript_3098:1378-1617(+)
MDQQDIIKMQNRLLKEEKAELESINSKKSISERTNINKIEEEKSSTESNGDSEKPKNGDSSMNIGGSGGVMNKFKRDNS